jgi:hypothetical protein
MKALLIYSLMFISCSEKTYQFTPISNEDCRHLKRHIFFSEYSKRTYCDSCRIELDSEMLDEDSTKLFRSI